MREEVYNFLLSSKNLVLKEENISPENHEIFLHFKGDHSFKDADFKGDDSDGYVEINTKKIKEKYVPVNFHITLNKNQQSLHINEPNNFSTIKPLENGEYVSENTLDMLFNLMSYFHELRHVVQSIKNHEQANFEDDKLENLSDTIFVVENFMPHSKEQRLFRRVLKRHRDMVEFNNPLEKDANKYQFLYLENIIRKIIKFEKQNSNDAQLLNMLYIYSNILIHNIPKFDKQSKLDHKTDALLLQKLYENSFYDKYSELIESD